MEELSETKNDTKEKISKRRIVIFALEITLIVFLLLVWFTSESIQQSKNLWVLFFYSFPCQFLIAIVPHEPVFLYFSKFYLPVTVTLVSVSGTILTEILNYSTFKFIVDFKNFHKLHYSGFLGKIIDIFNKVPFAALWIAGFTPVPFYPFRFLVVLAKYPIQKYILAVVLSRTPRFFLLALLGHAFKIPDYLLISLLVVLILIANVPIIKKVIEKKKQQKS